MTGLISGDVSTKSMHCLQKTSESLLKATDANAELKSALSDLAKSSFEAGAQTMQMAQENIVKPEELTLPSATFFDQVTQAINAQLKLNDSALIRLDAALNNRVAVLKTTLYELILALVTLLSVIAWLGYRITTSVTGPLHQAVYFADKIAKGDLTGRIVSSSQNEIGQLLQALSMMNDGLVRIVNEVRNWWTRFWRNCSTTPKITSSVKNRTCSASPTRIMPPIKVSMSV